MSNHSFDIHIAEEYKSTDIAILVWHFQYWISRNKRLKRNFIEERTWTYQSIKEIASVFPYWSVKQIERLLTKAVALKILIKGNFNKSGYDRTAWYAFENEEKFGISRFREMDSTESGNGSPEIGRPIPDTLTYTETDREGAREALTPPASFASHKKKEKPEKDLYLEFVLLSKEEHEKLLKLYGGQENLLTVMQMLNAAIGSKGHAYKSHYFVLGKGGWAYREFQKSRQKSIGGSPRSQKSGEPYTPSSTEFVRNKRICDAFEAIAQPFFHRTNLFHSQNSQALLSMNGKETWYEYSRIEPEEMKRVLEEDLGNAFGEGLRKAIEKMKNKK